MPEYVVKVKSPEALSGFELRLLEDKVRTFFYTTAVKDETIIATEVKAEYK